MGQETGVFRQRGPLADLRVVEMGVLLAGPFCGSLFADFGAEVIKVETPGSGDPMRGYGQAKVDGEALWWPVLARNKKSITLNLREEEGQSLLRQLVARADVVLENFRPGTMERWGLGYEALCEVNPRIVMVRVSGFGQTGPYASRPGYAAVGEAMGGLRYVMGDPTRPPSRAGVSIGDTLAGTFAALGAIMAIHAREHTGRGQVVDASIYESVLTVMEGLIPEYQLGGHIRERSGAILPKVAPSNVYPTSDGKLVLIAGNQDTVFRRMAVAMGQPELASPERFGLHAVRGEKQQELDEIVSAWTATLTAQEVCDALEEHAVPFGTLYRAPEMLEDPHFKAREAIVRMLYKGDREIAMQNVFPKLTDTPGGVRWIGPELGAHTEEILGGLLGLPAERIAALRERGIV